MDILAAVGGGFFGLIVGKVIPFLIILTVVVFIHELGHFLVGRWCGVGVHAFSVGFGPEIVGFTDRHGTRWKFSAIPLGGYVKFVGDQNGASVPDAATLARMDPRERALSFHHKSVAKRAAIVAAGPIANFLLAIAIFTWSTYTYGRQVVEPRVTAVVAESPAERAGFKPGDLVLSINNRPIRSFDELFRIVSAKAEETLTIVVDRDGERVTLTAAPDLKEEKTPFGKHQLGRLGLQGPPRSEARHTTYGLVESFGIGVYETYYVVERTFDYLGKLIVGRESIQQLSGPIGIADVAGKVAAVSWTALIGLTAVLSVSIGLINLFPIPLLDGGHLMFYAVEALRGRPLSERMQEIGFRIGFAIVILLMVFATWNDIINRVAPSLFGGT
jgi:regulator of sigma E protease